MATVIGVSKGRKLSDFQALKGYTTAQASSATEVGTALKHLDYKDYSNGTEPLVTKDINEMSSTKNQNGWYRQYAQGADSEVTNRVDDVVRITKWIGTPRGVLWEARQSALEAVQTDLDRKRTEYTRVYGGLTGTSNTSQSFWNKVGSGLSDMWQKVKDIGSGVVSSVGLTAATLEQVAGAGTGLHTEPYITRAYLRTGSKGVLGQLLATVGIGTSMYISGAKHALAGTEVPVPDEHDLGGLSLQERRWKVGTRIKTLQVGLDPEDKKAAYTSINGTRKDRPSKDLIGIGSSELYLTETGTVQKTFKYRGRLSDGSIPEGDTLHKQKGNTNAITFQRREGGTPEGDIDQFILNENLKARGDRRFKEDYTETTKPWDVNYLKDRSIVNTKESYPLNATTILNQSATPEGDRNKEQVNEKLSGITNASLERGIRVISGSFVGEINAHLGKEVRASGQASVLGDEDLKKLRYYWGSNNSKTIKEERLKVDKALHLAPGNRFHSAKNSTGKDDSYSGSIGRHAQTAVETKLEFEARVNESTNLVPFYFQIKDRFIEFEATLESYSDQYTGNWDSTQYIGRGENFYTYNNFDRTIQFKFVALARNPESLKPLYQKLNRLASATAPWYNPHQNYFMNGPISIITIGDLLKEQWGFFQSVNLSWQTDYLWEINNGQVQDIDKGYRSQQFIRVPHALDVDVSFKPIHTFNVDIRNADYFAVYDRDGTGTDTGSDAGGSSGALGGTSRGSVTGAESDPGGKAQ